MTSQLQKVLSSRSVRKNVDIKLASGAQSNVYVDCKLSTLHGPSLKVIGEFLFQALQKMISNFHADSNSLNESHFYVAGVSVGGDPLVAAVILEAEKNGTSLEGLLIRKEPKSHGASQGKAVDGFPPRQNYGVILVEDVITSGASSYKACEFLMAEGYKLRGILALVDREAGGVEYLSSKLSVPVITLTKLSEL